MSRNAAGFDLSALPSSSKEAEQIGCSYFFTGRPCSRGHVYMRYTKGGRCAFCQRESNAEKHGHLFDPAKSYAERHLKRLLADKSGHATYVPVVPCKNGHSLRFVGSNNCVECDKISRKKHLTSGKLARIKKEYGLSREQYHALVEKQGSRCAICGTYEQDSFRLHVDHCHKKGAARALLCSKCNQGIGLFKESKERLLAAINYLRSYEA